MIQLLTNGLILEFLSVKLICLHTERKEVRRGREYEEQEIENKDYTMSKQTGKGQGDNSINRV